jgi:hypothetical protein
VKGDNCQGPDPASGLLALVAYLSTQFNAISRGWPPCLRTLEATAVLMAEADKLSLGQELTDQVSHSILTLMEYKGNY